jgi:hypothetical protein
LAILFVDDFLFTVLVLGDFLRADAAFVEGVFLALGLDGLLAFGRF